MKSVKKYSLHNRLKSFVYAFRGIKELWRQEPNFKIHISALFSAIILGFILKVSSLEWSLIIILAALVLAAEAFNTAIENMCDMIDTETNEKIRIIKDIAAAAVLITATSAFIIGLIVFVPKLLGLF